MVALRVSAWSRAVTSVEWMPKTWHVLVFPATKAISTLSPLSSTSSIRTTSCPQTWCPTSPHHTPLVVSPFGLTWCLPRGLCLHPTSLTCPRAPCFLCPRAWAPCLWGDRLGPTHPGFTGQGSKNYKWLDSEGDKLVHFDGSWWAKREIKWSKRLWLESWIMPLNKSGNRKLFLFYLILMLQKW